MKKQPMPKEKVGWLLLLKFESAIISDLQLFTYFFICSQEDVFICMDRKSSEKWVMKEEDPNVVQNPNLSSRRIPFSVANNLIEE